MPHSYARWAVNRSPVNRISLAARGPITHGCAKYSTPGIPIRTTGSAKNASSEATIRSHDEREHQPAGDAGALHHRDHRLGDLAPAPAHAEVDLHLARVAQVAALAADVVPPDDRASCRSATSTSRPGVPMSWPAREVLAGAGEHDHLDLVVVDGALERRVERIGHRRVLRVAVVGTVHRDDRRRPAHLVQHLVAHRYLRGPRGNAKRLCGAFSWGAHR